MDHHGDHPPSYVDDDGHSSTFEPADDISHTTDAQPTGVNTTKEPKSHLNFNKQGMLTQTTGLTLYGNAFSFAELELKIVELGSCHDEGNANNSGIHVLGNLEVDLLDKKTVLAY